jgi:hypothetical protein
VNAASSGCQSFPHRANDDGTFDAICPRCFVTVSQQRREADLEQFERDHICDEWLLEKYGAIEPKPESVNGHGSPDLRRAG